MSELLISVVICTHNPRPDYLNRVLQALSKQTLPPSNWELLIIDNASIPSLASFGDLTWHPHAQIAVEKTLGVYYARLRGIKDSRAPIILYVDDDNVLAPDYLEQVLAINQEFPQLGTWGAGLIQPDYEKEPDPELKPFCEILALRNIQHDTWTTSQKLGPSVPYGAGMAMRRSIATAFIEHIERIKGQVIFGPRGSKLNSAEDIAFSLFAADRGSGYGLFRRLSITHLIPERRVQRDYLFQIWEAYSYGNFLLELVRQDVKGAPRFGFMSIARELLAPLLKALFGSSMRRAVFRRVFIGRWRAWQEYEKPKA